MASIDNGLRLDVLWIWIAYVTHHCYVGLSDYVAARSFSYAVCALISCRQSLNSVWQNLLNSDDWYSVSMATLIFLSTAVTLGFRSVCAKNSTDMF